MKTSYKEIRTAIQRVKKAREERNKRARINTGVISGDPDMTSVNSEFEEAYSKLSALVRSAIANGARLPYLLSQIKGEKALAEFVRIEIFYRKLRSEK